MPVLGKSKKEVLTEFRTAEILAAARSVFAEKGFHATTVEEIAEAVEVAKGTLYLYYPSKQAIYWAALEQGIREMHAETRRRLEAAPTLQEKVRTNIEFKIRYFEENRDFFKIYYTEFGNALSHPAQVGKHFCDLYLEHMQALAAVIRDGIARGEIRDVPPEIAAHGISELLRGVIIQRIMGWSTRDVQETIDFVFNFVWKGIAGR